MADWRVAKSLETLRAQVDALAPGRNKSDDGTIGDSAHQARHSDHNPDAEGVVRALDITHDPAHGVDTYAMAEVLRQSKDPRISYIISDIRICNSKVDPWEWRPYSGPDPHTGHVHISVVADDALADDTKPWAIAGKSSAVPIQSGKASWYSQFEGKYQWVDQEDIPNSNALGVPDSEQGIAFYSRGTLGKWFEVTAPNGVALNLRQTDIGPNPRTGRTIDISAAAAERFGYTPKDFPTDGVFHWRPAAEPAKAPVTPVPAPSPVPAPQIDWTPLLKALAPILERAAVQAAPVVLPLALPYLERAFAGLARYLPELAIMAGAPTALVHFAGYLPQDIAVPVYIVAAALGSLGVLNRYAPTPAPVAPAHQYHGGPKSP